jgi:hypothetical protein
MLLAPVFVAGVVGCDSVCLLLVVAAAMRLLLVVVFVATVGVATAL